MKRYVKHILAFAVILISSACNTPIPEQEEILTGDLTPIVMCIYVHNSEGVDLLDPQSESSIDIGDIILEYEGESYSVKDYSTSDNDAYYSTTRYFFGHFDGISLRYLKESDYCLLIGCWNSDAKRDYTEMTLHWGNGASDTFGFTSDYDYDPSLKNDPDRCWGYKFYRSGFLNGKVVDADNDPQLEFTIIR